MTKNPKSGEEPLKNPGQKDRVVAFIDIGTNSVRLLVVRINPNNSYTILTRQKQQVRLGEGEFENEEILPEAMERTIVVCKSSPDLPVRLRPGSL
jgi:exopolyphosphatase/guanosine-5'-triphosphate,3'-diphosphate pyrophosphatase